MFQPDKRISQTEQRLGLPTIVRAGLIASAYAVSTMVLAPLAFGPVQLRVGGLLMPLCLIHPVYGLGLAVGVGLANIFSPFGWYDFLVMPLVTLVLTLAVYRLRAVPSVALLFLAWLMANAIAFFPLHLGGGIPYWPTVVFVFLSLVLLYLAGWYGIWRNVKEWL